MKEISSPILLIIYKRLETTRAVFNKIKQARPPRLYISANAPNPANATDARKVTETREIIKEVDWPCEVITNFRDHHLSAKESITSGISWFFSKEESGIILEDDCVVDETFFVLCDDLLKRYADNEQIMHIGASNFQEGIVRGDGSYYFSKYNHIWGWAGWRRSWSDFNLKLDNEFSIHFDNVLSSTFIRKDVRNYWKQIHRYLSTGKVDTWDVQYMFHLWRNNGIAITPNVNLVKNVGFGVEATNTNSALSKWANMKVDSLQKIVHPSKFAVDAEADSFTSDNLFGIRKASRYFFIKLRVSRLIPVSLKAKLKRHIRLS
jgi:hypothetical protein